MIRFTVSILLIMAVSGCSAFAEAPDVAACDVFIQRGLLSPSSYRRVSFLRVDGEPMPGKEFPDAAGLVRPREGDLDRETWDMQQRIYHPNRLALRELAVEYDSHDENGVPVRGRGVCAFRLIDGDRLEPTDTLMTRARGATAADGIDTLDRLKGRQMRRRPRYPCCL